MPSANAPAASATSACAPPARAELPDGPAATRSSAARGESAATNASYPRNSATRQVAEFLGYEAFVAADSPRAAELRVAAGPSGSSALAGGAHALVALAAGAFALGIDSSPYRGTVTGAAFRRGRAEVTVEGDGIGRVTALAPARTALPEPGPSPARCHPP